MLFDGPDATIYFFTYNVSFFAPKHYHLAFMTISPSAVWPLEFWGALCKWPLLWLLVYGWKWTSPVNFCMWKSDLISLSFYPCKISKLCKFHTWTEWDILHLGLLKCISLTIGAFHEWPGWVEQGASDCALQVHQNLLSCVLYYGPFKRFSKSPFREANRLSTQSWWDAKLIQSKDGGLISGSPSKHLGDCGTVNCCVGWVKR